ncbi:hypothetical protein GCM10023146_40920 [Nocardioides caricicola]
MVRRLASLDTSPLTRPVWLTFTLPGRLDGVPAAASGPEYRKALNRLFSRWERAWGSVALVWKLEWTVSTDDRIAPHLHVLATVPEDMSFGEWHCWLARAWTASVAASGLDPVEEWQWLIHGVWAQLVEGAEPARRAARYFSFWKPGRSGRNQDMPPPSWLEPGCGLRRVWGVRGMVAVEEEHQLTPLEAKWAARLARRWASANLPPPRSRRRRASGRLTHVVRPWPLSSQGGWLIIPDGRAPAVGEAIAAAAVEIASQR